MLPRPHGYRKRYPSHKGKTLPEGIAPRSHAGIENDTRHTKENTDHRGNLPRPHGYRKRYPAVEGTTFNSTLLAFFPFRFVFAVGDGLQGEVV